jgi:hypothetical protein
MEETINVQTLAIPSWKRATSAASHIAFQLLPATKFSKLLHLTIITDAACRHYIAGPQGAQQQPCNQKDELALSSIKCPCSNNAWCSIKADKAQPMLTSLPPTTKSIPSRADVLPSPLC